MALKRGDIFARFLSLKSRLQMNSVCGSDMLNISVSWDNKIKK